MDKDELKQRFPAVIAELDTIQLRRQTAGQTKRTAREYALLQELVHYSKSCIRSNMKQTTPECYESVIGARG